MESPEEKPPFFSTWSRLYVFVLVYLFLLIALFTGITQIYTA